MRQEGIRYSHLNSYESTVGCGNVPIYLKYISDNANPEKVRNSICFGLIRHDDPKMLVTVDEKDEGNFFVLDTEQRKELAHWLLEGIE
jgi:hypothetical protein